MFVQLEMFTALMLWMYMREQMREQMRLVEQIKHWIKLHKCDENNFLNPKNY